MRWLGLVVFLAGCLTPSAVPCDDGRICPATTRCDEVHHTCVDPTQLERCVGTDDGTTCAIDAPDDGICDAQVCIVAGCGDGYLREPELCDGDSTIAPDVDCRTLGFYEAGPLTCNSVCGYDDAQCRGFCGDGMVTPGFEVCEDGVIEPSLSCVDLGYGAGNLGCSLCAPGIAECRLFDWQQDNVPPLPRAISGVADDDIFIVGGASAAMAAHYDGTTWTPIDVTSCVGSVLLWDVWAIGAGDAIAIGSSGKVVRLTPTTCTPIAYPRQTRLASVWASSATNIYVTELSSGVWRFDGASWTNVVAGAASVIDSLWGSGPDDIYALIGNAALHHFDGSVWSDVTAEAPAMTTINDVWGSSASDVYLGGTSGTHGFVARYDGVSWTTLLDGGALMPDPSSTIGTGFARSGKVYVTGARLDGPVLLVHDGAGWTNIALPTNTYGPVWTAPSGRLFTTGFVARMYSLRDLRFDSKIPEAASPALAVAGGDQLWATGAKLYRWDGVSWSVDRDSPAYVDVGPAGEVFAVSPTDGLLKYQPSGGPPWTTAEAGITGIAVAVGGPDDAWILSASGTQLVHWKGPLAAAEYFTVDDGGQDAAFVAIAIASPSHVFAVGFGGIVVHWNGSAWTKVTTPFGTSDVANRVRVRDPDSVYVVGNGRVLECTAQACTELALPPNMFVNDIARIGPQDLFVTTYEQGVMHFDGAKWSPVATGTTFEVGSLVSRGDSVYFTDTRGGVHQLMRLSAWPTNP